MKPDEAAHIRDRYAAAVIVREPFPHVVIGDVLPPAIYNAMEQALPSRQRLRLASIVDTFKKQPLREAVDQVWRNRPNEQATFAVRKPDDRCSFGLSRYSRDWVERFGPYVELIDHLTIAAFADEITAHRNRIAKYGVKIAEDGIALEEGVFTHRGDNWGISPHAHRLDQIVQTLIYFPLPNSNRNQGTVFYRLARAQTVAAKKFCTTVHFDLADLEKVIVVPYQRNSLVSFVNTPEAIHSTPDVAGPPRRYIFSSITVPVELGDGLLPVGPI